MLVPFLLIICILVLSTSKGPIFFVQKRVGKSLQLFELYKFRSLTDRKHEIKKFVEKGKEITWIGYYLRRFKIDEIPQLLNVVKGDMSLVGPRPGIPEQLEEMSIKSKKRYSVRPGMTGLAQVSGNIRLDWEERFEYDLMYIRSISLLNDFRILFRTCKLIFVGEENYIHNPPKIKVANED